MLEQLLAILERNEEATSRLCDLIYAAIQAPVTLEQTLEMLARNEKAMNRLCDLIEGGYVAIPTPVTLEQTLEAPAVEAKAPAVEAKAPAVEAPAVEAPAPAEKTLDDVKIALNALIKARGKDAVVASLAKFGVAKLSELKPAQYNAVIAELNGARVDED